MAVNDSYADASTGIADTGTFTVDGSGSGTGAVLITELGGTGDFNVFRDVDTTDDGTYDATTQIESTTGEWHSQANDLICSQSQNVRLRIKNVSGGSITVFVSGYEVDN